jgi:hypothetical protein
MCHSTIGGQKVRPFCHDRIEDILNIEYQIKEKVILKIILYYIKNNIIFNLVCYSEQPTSPLILQIGLPETHKTVV